ncbi:hypothetical protein [Flavobacterium sp. JP2137]|uniref:hypothetical protein n=1 Tax=Flavobacterium sp. JP2137 TaxID=3414510 RepID=UPI003D300F8F
MTRTNLRFRAAAVYSTNNLRASAYQSVYQRNVYYGWVQGQVDAKGYGSKWFGAAHLVTGLRGVGGTEIPDGGKSYNFKNYDDTVKLSKELIKKAHNE